MQACATCWLPDMLVVARFTGTEFYVQFISEPCDGQPDFDVLDQVHGLVINYLIFTLIATFCHCTFICAAVEIQSRMWTGRPLPLCLEW